MIRDGIEWQIFPGQIPYPEALALMEERVMAIHAGEAPEAIWLMEHPALLTAGLGANPETLPAGISLPILPQRRGGGYLYRGPGIRMVYPLLRVTAHAPDVACFVRGLEKWAIAALAEFNLAAQLRPGHLGVWVPGGTGAPSEAPALICEVSVRLRRGISLQGFAVNVEPDLALLRVLREPLAGEITSLVDLGYPVTFEDLDVALLSRFTEAMASVGGSCTTS